MLWLRCWAVAMKPEQQELGTPSVLTKLIIQDAIKAPNLPRNPDDRL